LFKNERFDLMADDAPDQIYRLAAIFMPTNMATLLKELYAGADTVASKMNIYEGLLKQVGDIRGLNLTLEGNTVARILAKKGDVRYGLGDGPLSRKALYLLSEKHNSICS
jgi:hypothetical protein